jgi:hypothetical protein
MSETNLSVPASLDIDSGNKNVSQRDAKGYNFEVKVNNVLNDVGITYLSNPLNNIKEWKSRQGKGSDFKIPLWNWEIEAKYSDAKIFPSWIKRDYIPRFSKNSFKLVVHNEAMKLTNGSLELCFLYDIYLVEIGYLKYVLKIEMKHRQEGNKLLEAKNSESELGNNINLENKSSNIGEANKLLEAESNEKEVTNDKNESENSKRELDPSDLEKERSQNNEARTEEKTNGSTFKEIFPVSVKIKTFYNRLKTLMLNLLSEIEMLFSKIWNDKHGEITLANWIPVKLRTKNKTRARSQKLFPCPFRVVVICPYHSQFYTCFLLIFFDYVKRLLKYRCYDEDEIYSRAKSYLLYRMWIYKNHILAKCKCKPKSIIDNEIVDRQFRSPLSSFEPCKNYRCTFMINKKICPYLLTIKKTSIKPKQLNLSVFMNGDECNEEEARS